MPLSSCLAHLGTARSLQVRHHGSLRYTKPTFTAFLNASDCSSILINVWWPVSSGLKNSSYRRRATLLFCAIFLHPSSLECHSCYRRQSLPLISARGTPYLPLVELGQHILILHARDAPGQLMERETAGRTRTRKQRVRGHACCRSMAAKLPPS